ncbi:hypothetical protein PI124_g18550 [Phytophthora idaei]|nr:hypothetical protein PI125_g22407 [Phytophthora idaei]KAG3236440.1 hypothetical protein PI124_g18550 [Phytophthora idaei]
MGARTGPGGVIRGAKSEIMAHFADPQGVYNKYSST